MIVCGAPWPMPWRGKKKSNLVSMKAQWCISKYDACGFYLFTASCMQRWMTMSRIPSRDTAAFESNLKFLNIDETIIRSQPIVNGRKLEAVLKLAFYGSQEYAENIIRCIGMFSLLTRILKWYRKLSAEKHYRKHGSTSYIVREVRSVRERERERDTEREREREIQRETERERERERKTEVTSP